MVIVRQLHRIGAKLLEQAHINYPLLIRAYYEQFGLQCLVVQD